MRGLDWLSSRRFDLVELLMVSAMAALVSGLIAASPPRPSPEVGALAAKYGPSRNSEHEEEWIVRDFFGDERDGFFVDVGANDYRTFSNTYYLESALGWSGLAIEPLGRFAADYERYRPRSRFRRFFVSDVSNQEATLYLLEKNPLVTSSQKGFTERWGQEVEEVTAPTITLDALLEAERVPRIDFLSMDIELAEPKALAGFDLARYRPRLVCVEAHAEVRQAILDYFARRAYVVLGKYLRADRENLWFAPLGAPGA